MLKHLPAKFFFFSLFVTFFYTQARIIETNYGSIDVQEQVILDLIDHPAMQRLKYIHQYGGGYYVIHNYEYHRFEHSLGVFALLRYFNAPLKEQIAGLLHDVSHTIFSHVGDHFFNHSMYGDSYQDNIHEWYLEQSGIVHVLKKHGFEVKEILHKNKEFQQLEQPLPNICTDRLEYVLWGGYLEKVLSRTDIDEILQDLRFEDGTWYFTHKESALKFARSSLFLTEHLFTSYENALCNTLMSRLLHCAIDHKLLTLHDVHFGRDDEIWQKLKKSKNEKIHAYFHSLYTINSAYHTRNIVSKETIHVSSKFRGINPWVKTQVGMQRLDELDAPFNNEYSLLKRQIMPGLDIQLLSE